MKGGLGWINIRNELGCLVIGTIFLVLSLDLCWMDLICMSFDLLAQVSYKKSYNVEGRHSIKFE